ncbi:MFS transporter [Streptomyces sp. NBC_01795]|uniref:MFS transporter n=1 Tax=unclassified Streptomyces TaxID=2593676 RepID=UPI002DDB0E85|nr:MULTISPECIES: MFS transporter [unclassified Streptomyces]WSA97221.1 MFS transporter [Streptomyces sp. NBC_01795]WSS17588.1 MFS transporter [Streptomyces sp. NBC_01186]
MAAALRRIQLGNALAAFGNGFTVPFLFVYVARVRDLGDGTAGAVLAAFAAAALLVLPFTGRVIDRSGPLVMVVIGAVAAALGALGFGLSTSAPTVLAASALMGAGIAVLQPALATMIVWCSTPGTRSRAFATQFFLNNLGLGVGGLLGGLLVDESDPSSFTLLFTIEATMFLVLLTVLVTVRVARPEQPGAPVSSGGSARGSGWGVLLRDRSMVLLCVLGFVVFFSCYGQFESGLSAYAVEVTRISTATLGIALAANTAMIVLAQFVVLRLVERRRRSRVVAVVGLIWTVAWLGAGASGLVHGAQAVATALLIGTYALFGIGETMLSPTMAPLVADLAPARFIGQYNSAFALVKQLALAVGPAIGGLMAAAGAWWVYIGMLVLCSLGIAVLALVLGRRLTVGQDRPASVVVARGGPCAGAESEASGADATAGRVATAA